MAHLRSTVHQNSNRMEPQHLRFGGGVGETVLNPVIFALVFVAGVLICLLPRRKAMVPFLVASILVPLDQVLLLGPMHFPMMRLLVVFGAIRILKDRNRKGFNVFSGGLNRIDLALILLTVFTAINGILLFRESGAVIFQLGNLYTTFGIYFLLRFPDPRRRRCRPHDPDPRLDCRIHSCDHGEGDIVGTQSVRDSRRCEVGILCQPYGAGRPLSGCGLLWPPHSGGNFWGDSGSAVCASMEEGWQRPDTRGGRDGCLTVIVLTSELDTPVLAYVGGLFAILLWPIRRRMRLLRWAIVITLVSLHMVMKAPVWHLISRIDISGGSLGIIAIS